MHLPFKHYALFHLALENGYISRAVEYFTFTYLLLFTFFFGFSLVSEVIFVITSAVKDVCGKPPSERLFLDKYGRICLCLDEIVWQVRRHTEQF